YFSGQIMSSTLRLAISGLAVLGICSAALAQYPYPPGYGFYPWYPGGRVAGQMQGAASIISASGSFLTQQEQARLMREQAEQATLDTQRKAFDQAMYERSMTPSFAEKQQKEQADQLQRVMTVPQDFDITSGKAGNLMLPLLRSLSSQGIQGPPVLLDPEQMRRVNVTVGSSSSGLGPLMNAGYITDWPLALQGPTQEKLAVLLPMAVAEATAGKLSPKTYTQVKGLTAQLRQEVI